MVFESFSTAAAVVLGVTFVLAFIMGAVANKTNFCTMGAVSDWVNMGDLGRMRSWILAIAVAMLGVVVLESMGLVNADGAFPPYRSGQFAWVEHLLGGLMFGIGMTYASGCGNKTLVRVGGGNIKSIMVLLIIAVIAYFMVNPIPGSSNTLYSLLFYSWTNPLAVNLGSGQDLGSLVASGEGAVTARLIIGGILGLALLFWVFKSADFRSTRDNIIGGLVIGAVVVGAWFITSSVQVGDEMEQYELRTYVQEWDFLADDPEGRPAEAMPWSSQSFTFINPMGQSLRYVASGFDNAVLYFGVIALFGVIVGSLFWALVSKSFRIEWFASFRDFVNHFIGAILMGFGGVLAMGCTIGQGITGISTLALGGFLTFIAIVLGAALTMKVQYYKMVYEDEATFLKALITGLVDLKLLPSSMRKLEAI
ncbi:YeeE/YedE family protein [Thioalkalivibrio sulfidiphilus]|uniref:YeeE/YedE family protein n=1 Tax=Thioalkalivibrio sulfidiphilus TaxID=1033854 RepID=UPI00037A7FF9|nr:YeeE/YedE family protein [Thioalkalivibrio sulfidiphilus]